MFQSNPISRRLWSPLIILALLGLAPASPAEPVTIRPGQVWPDDRGRHIQAHGGSILRFNGAYYWFGEDRSRENEPTLRYVSCYVSTDLAHWRFLNQVVRQADPEHFGTRWLLERPKVFFNAKTGHFVMYMHIDGPTPGGSGDYSLARVGVAVSDRVDGAYRYVRSFRPLGEESRDIGQFVDDDGSAYLIFESRPTKGFFIARLSEDYLDVAEKTCFIRAPLEGGALVRFRGLYYVVGSALTGWVPNPNKYATAKSLKGPWSDFRDIAPPETNTYGSQSGMILKVVGSRRTTVIFMGDSWKPNDLADSRYLWMPLELDADRLRLPQPVPWVLDAESGESSIP